MPEKIIQENFNELVIKILLPAFLTVAVGVAIEMKNDKSKVSWLNASLSFVIGVSGAYLASEIIAENFKGGLFTIVLCVTTLLTEKVVKFMMNKLNIDAFLMAVIDTFFDSILKFRKK